MSEQTDGFYRLNEYQRAAVLDESPACVVNANVGSGKTTVLIEKIMYLHMKRQVPLEKMIVLTFTNKAADEIVDRLRVRKADITPEQVQGFGTFHSVALRMLKNDLPVEEAGWMRDFTVMDPDEETDLALDIIAEHGLKVKYKNRLKKRLEQEYSSWLAGKEEPRYKDDLFLLYPLLLEEKKRQNKMSFTDLLRVSTELLRTESRWSAESGDHGSSAPDFYPEWILVDEVQDSDAMQLQFLETLRGGGAAKIFAVGDPNQVIYSWRGTGDNMFFLMKHRFGAKELTLPVNYRSNASILSAANRFLQFGSKIQGSRNDARKIVVKNHYDPFQEAEYLAEKIRTLHGEGKRYRDIAVFYRLQSQSAILEKVFERQGIPFELSVRKTLKDIPVLNWLVKVLRASVNPADMQTAAQVLADPGYGEKCSKKKAKDIVGNAVENISAGKAAAGKRQEKDTWAESLYRRIAGFSEDIGSRSSVSAEELFAYFGLREALHPASADYADDERLVKEFLERMCSACSPRNGEDTAEPGEMSSAAAIREFINSSALYGMKIDAGEKAVGENDEYEDKPGKADGEPGNKRETPDKVRLMTLHASKGLEFDTVFIIGVNQGLIPLRCRSYEQEEEERRLFFVGITRAENSLELSWYTNPGEPGAAGEPSRYLRMIPEQLLERDDVKNESGRAADLQRMRRQVQEQIRLKRESGQNQEDDGAKAEEGPEVIRVRHRRYGEGILISEDEMMVEAEFGGYGRKQFLKAFNELEILK